LSHPGGYGHYSYFEKMTPREAWDTFGKGNGVYDLTELAAKTSGYATHHSTKFDPNEEREIGCIVLDRPVGAHPDSTAMLRNVDPVKIVD